MDMSCGRVRVGQRITLGLSGEFISSSGQEVKRSLRPTQIQGQV